MRLHYVTRKHMSHVELMKDGKSSVGIVPKGAAKHGRPFVKSIDFKSVAHRSHCVSIGDVILTVCGQDSSGMGKRDIRRRFHNTERVDLELEYEIREPRLSTSRIYRSERVAVNIKKTLDSFGFTLRKHAKTNAVSNEYPIISNITQHAPVDKEVFVSAGDRLIQVDDEDLSWLSLAEISNILEEKEEATFLVEYSVGISDTTIRPGERTELEIERLDADLGIVLASSSKDESSIFIERIQKGSMAERCGVFHVGDVVLCVNDISTAHLSACDANALIRSFKKRPGKLIFVKKPGGFLPKSEIIPNTFESSTNGQAQLHPLLHTLVSDEPGYLIPPQNSPASLYNWHFRRTHSTLAKTDRKSFDFQSRTISLLRDVILNISSLQQLIPVIDCHPSRSCKNPHHTCHPDAYDTNRLSQLEAMCTETKDSARTIAMHFVKNTINVSLLNDTSDKSLDGICGNTGDNSYFTRSKMIQELTENLTEIYTKKFISKHALDRFLGNVSAVDFDCYECYQLCLSAALTVQKVMLLLSLNDPDLDAMFVINTLIMSVVQVDVPCEDCRTPWCSVSEIGITDFYVKEEDNHPCDLSCRSENFQSAATDPFYLSLMHHTGLSSPRDSLNGSKDNIARTFNRTYSKRSGVNLNVAQRSAFYSLAQIQSDLSSTTASEREIVCGLQPEKILINTQNMHPGNHSCISQISHIFTELPKVPNNSPSDSKKSERSQLSDRRTVIAENYTQNCREKIHVDKNLLSTPKQEWKSEEAISKSKSKNTLSNKLKSVITKHASDPSGFVKNLQKPMDIFKSCKTSPRTKTPATDVTDCIRSQSTSSNNAESRLSLDTLGSIKSHSSTMEVNLRNEGTGFGLEIGFLGSTKDSPMMPVIVDVEADSAAAKTGVLLKGDRIASINGQSAVGLTVDEFTNLTKVAFAREEVSLTVDFDVALPEVRFGTFDIYFDKDLKTGLEFKDFSKGSPLVVKGVVKGSAAHRSGQLFAGDEILFTNCIRQEAFDSRRCSYRRTEMVLMTVRREHRDSDSESNPNPASEASDPLQYPPTSGSVDACAVQRTSIHTVSGSSALVLEQQIALRRDPRLKDFGFLVGQNQMTGGVYVTGIRPGGPADRSKVVKKNDRIMEIDGTPVGNKESSSLSLLLQAGDHLELVTRRVLSCKE